MSRDTSPQERPARPPEFLLDRCITQRVAEALRERGWVVYRIADLFPNDAQEVADDSWLAVAAEHDWVGLTQDAKLWKHLPVPLPVFCLADGNLGTPAKIEWLVAAEDQIRKLAAKYTPGLWIVNKPPQRVKKKRSG